MLLGMFELVGILFHTCRPWPGVISAYNGTVMKQIIDGRLSNAVCSFEEYDIVRSSRLGKGWGCLGRFYNSRQFCVVYHLKNSCTLHIPAAGACPGGGADRSVTQDPQHLDATSSWNGQFGDVGEQK